MDGPITGVTAVLAILSGLEHVAAGGKGMHFDLSMTEATMALLIERFLEYLESGVEPEPQGNASPFAAIHDTYEPEGENWVAISAHTSAEQDALVDFLVEADAIPAPTVPIREIDAGLRRLCRQLSRESLVERLGKVGVCAVPVLAFHELPSSPQFVERRLAKTLVNENLGDYLAIRLPWHEFPSPDYRYTPAPKLGQHNESIFRDILKLSDADLAALEETDIIV